MALEELVMTEANQEEKHFERPSQYTVSMKLNVKELKGINSMNKNASANCLNLEKGSAILKKEILHEEKSKV